VKLAAPVVTSLPAWLRHMLPNTGRLEGDMILGRIPSAILAAVAVGFGALLAVPFMIVLLTPLFAVARAVG
jgi:hypothetical protein